MAEMFADEEELKRICSQAYPVFVEKLAEHDAEAGENEDPLPAWEELDEGQQNAWCAFAEKVFEEQKNRPFRDTAINRGF